MPTNTPFALAVQRLLEERRATLRSQRQRTGIAHSTIKNWLDGVRPSMDSVIAFARGFDQDVNQWLVLAGYDPIDGRLDEPTPDERLGRGLRELAAKHDQPELTVKRLGGRENLTHEDVDRILRETEEDILAEREEERKRGS